MVEKLELYIDKLLNKLEMEEKSKNTVTTYHRTYKHFILFLKDEGNMTLNDISEDTIYSFLKYKQNNLNKQGTLSTATKNAIVIHLRRLFEYIEKNNNELLDFSNVFCDISFKQKREEPKGLTNNEFILLNNHLEALKSRADDYVTLRNIILMKLMLHGGLRASEALTIKYSDICFLDDGVFFKIRIVGKGNKVRFVYMESLLLEDELKEIQQYTTNILIATTKTESLMDRVQLSKMANSIYRNANLKIRGLHILRHTFAKRMLLSGVSLPVLQKLLGHSKIETTMIYANPHEDMILEDLKKTLNSNNI